MVRNLWTFLGIVLLLALAEPTVIGQGGGRDSNKPRPRTRTVRLKIISDPADCQVFVDGQLRGRTDDQGQLVIELPPGPRRVRVAREGYEGEERRINLTKAQDERFTLPPIFVTLTVSTDPPQAEVYLNGTHKGASGPDGQLTIPQVQAGRHTVRVQRSRYLAQEQSVRVLPDSATVQMRLAPDPLYQRIEGVERAVSAGAIAIAFDLYEPLMREKPEHPDVAALAETVVRGLQSRSEELLRQVGVFGLRLESDQVEEMNRLYERAQKWRPNDRTMMTVSHYWTMKQLGSKARQAASPADKDRLQQTYRFELETLSQSGLTDAFILYDLGWSYFSLGDRRAAEQHFVQARDQNPKWVFPKYALAKLRLDEAQQEKDKKRKEERYKQAIAGLTEAVTADPNFLYGYVDRCIAYADTKKHKEAIADGQKAVTLDPQSAYAHYALGFAYYRKGKSEFDKAQRALVQALASKADVLSQEQVKLVNQWLAEMKRK